jgi:hypothetical protein
MKLSTENSSNPSNTSKTVVCWWREQLHWNA